MAIKVLGVAGERVEGSEGDSTQDFLFVDGPVFAAPDAQGILKSLKLLAGTTDQAPNVKCVLSSVLQGAEKALEAVGGKSSSLIAMGGHPETHPLGATFFSQVPISPDLRGLKGVPIDIDEAGGTRKAVADFFSQHTGAPAQWELRVQLCSDLDTMPVEDASVEWPEKQSPFIAVARVTLGAQPGWNDALSREIDDGLAFNPWHALAAHRPLGNVMRARRVAYAASASFRGKRNGCPLHEPKAPSEAIQSH